MDNQKPKQSRAEINKRVWRAVDAAFENDVATLEQVVLTRAQANWVTPNRQGQSLLCCAVIKKSTEAIHWLLEKGADPNTLFEGKRRISPADATDWPVYESPFAGAIRMRDVGVIAAFLDHGALLSLPHNYFLSFHGGANCGNLLNATGLAQEVTAFREAKQLAQSTPPGLQVSSATARRL
ncbi:hypothetical protein SAMN05518669_101802 [Variovorax sp. YR634]|uniref:hypothetical protein n=1 Tax=Variovorax sp. YR634 TaxID=1884385 RepID=UPI0008991159|nr:hypothetical protein [Variovorax sp. YR634]SDW49935.1 hypothetical protein SAMN05518669_101802 [Variovorax sp. YR634]